MFATVFWFSQAGFRTSYVLCGFSVCFFLHWFLFHQVLFPSARNTLPMKEAETKTIRMKRAEGSVQRAVFTHGDRGTGSIFQSCEVSCRAKIPIDGSRRLGQASQADPLSAEPPWWPRQRVCWLMQQTRVPCLRRADGHPLQYPCLENPTDRGAWRGYAPWGRRESDTTERLTHTHTHTHTLFHQRVSLSAPKTLPVEEMDTKTLRMRRAELSVPRQEGGLVLCPLRDLPPEPRR